MKISIPAIKKNEQLFFFSYIIFLSFSILTHSFYYRYFAGIYKFIVLFCILVLVGQELINQRLSYKAGIGAVILAAVTLFLIVQGHGDLQIAFASIFIFTFSAREIEFKKISRITITVTLAILIIVILSSLAGIIPNYHTEINDRSRYYLGFRYALNAPAFLFNVILLETYVKGKNVKIHTIALLLIASYSIYAATDSRLSFFLSVLCLIVMIINKIRGDDFTNLKVIPRLLVPTFIICFVLSVWLTLTYSSSSLWMRELNTFLGGRLRMGQRSLLLYGVGIFGNHGMEWVGNGLNMYGEKNTGTYLYVDNLFIQVLQRYGILFTVIFLILATILMYQCYKKKENLLSIMLAFVAAHAMIDDTGLYLHFNTFWILFGPAAFGYLRQRQTQSVGKKRKTRMQIKRV